MAALASVIDSDDPEEIERIIAEGIPDPVGSFYRFSLAASTLRRSKFGARAASSGRDDDGRASDPEASHVGATNE